MRSPAPSVTERRADFFFLFPARLCSSSEASDVLPAQPNSVQPGKRRGSEDVSGSNLTWGRKTCGRLSVGPGMETTIHTYYHKLLFYTLCVGSMFIIYCTLLSVLIRRESAKPGFPLTVTLHFSRITHSQFQGGNSF